MTTANSDFNRSIGQIAIELEKIQGHLLMIKAANLAYNGCFNEGSPDTYSRSSYKAEDAAQYFIQQFLELEPEEIIEQAIDALYDLKGEFKEKNICSNSNKTSDATIKISIGRD